MRERKRIGILAGLVLSFSLLASSFTAAFLIRYEGREKITMLGEIFCEVKEKQPEAEQAFLSGIKKYKMGQGIAEEENLILAYGYVPADFRGTSGRQAAIFVLAGVLSGGSLLFLTLFFWHKKLVHRINDLTLYLEKVNTGSSSVLFSPGEDAFSKLMDEIYKTVTALYHTRDGALRAKQNFSENLYNIAHQIKTPITSISLSVQLMRKDLSPKYLEQMEGQISRLEHLEESLLLLSRIDSGTLMLERKEVDVFTLLMLAFENLEELFRESGVSVDIPEGEGAVISADLDWTMEAVMNLMKNCMEHTPPGGKVSCSYEQNPLYTQIKISDSGEGFSKKDIPHLFERFYRGEKEKNGGIGIGLALAKEIIERENGTVTARNLPGGGACFEIYFYAR